MKNAQTKRPTLEDVARVAGVSRSLASLALRGEPGVAARSRTAILEAARRLSYFPNVSARSLASASSKVLGLLIGTLKNPHHAAIAAKAADVGYREGYEVILSTVSLDGDQSFHAMQTLMATQIAGLMFVGVPLTDEQIAKIADEIPCATIGRNVSLPNMDAVYVDDEAGARLVVEHLVQLGHRRIAHLDGGRGAGAEERRMGYLAAMRENGLGSEALIVPGNYTSEGGEKAAAGLFLHADVPTAIFAANDYSAIGVLRVLLEKGLRVPQQVSLVGYDNSYLASNAPVGLTSVDQASAQLATEAVLRVITRIRETSLESKRIVTTPKLVVRQSIGRAPA
ncbi:MAG: LacI family DNA-binding transcriptional regulator [Trueperaceae bacterium]